MLKISLNKIKKYYGDRLLFECGSLRIYEGERIAITGVNGCGKTTLLDILSGVKTPDSGEVVINGSVSYAAQLDEGFTESGRGGVEAGDFPGAVSAEFNAADEYRDYLSGGEKTRYRISAALEMASDILIMDEPTSNLDMRAIEILEEKLKEFRGTLIIVSHDRTLLQKLCCRIIEIENSKINDFDCGYLEYEYQKKLIFDRAEFEYYDYLSEKKRIERAIVDKKQKSREMRKTPKRMGNSEARLHTRGINSKKKKIDGAAEALKSRLSQLEVKEKPYRPGRVKISVPEHGRVHARAVVSCDNLGKNFGEKIIFEDARFEIPARAKTALIGPNGCGKTTLIKMIMAAAENIRISAQARIGYFGQGVETLDYRKSVLENVLESSSYDETTVRTLLAGLLFRRDEVHKKASMLSGGERVKTAIAKILLAGFNFLVLDEPTNYLDLFSLAALEEVLADYDGAMLICSHDRRFVNSVADRTLIINDKSIITYEGKYGEYLKNKELDSPRLFNS